MLIPQLSGLSDRPGEMLPFETYETFSFSKIQMILHSPILNGNMYYFNFQRGGPVRPVAAGATRVLWHLKKYKICTVS